MYLIQASLTIYYIFHLFQIKKCEVEKRRRERIEITLEHMKTLVLNAYGKNVSIFMFTFEELLHTRLLAGVRQSTTMANEIMIIGLGLGDAYSSVSSSGLSLV